MKLKGTYNCVYINITKTCRSAFFHLHNIRRVRKYLSIESAEKLVHAFITSRLDYCNSLLYGLPHCALTKLQRVQNAAARVLYLAPRFCHITPILYELHWLPVTFRIEFKVIIITHKAIYGTAPNYLSSLVNFKPNSSYSLRSNNAPINVNPVGGGGGGGVKDLNRRLQSCEFSVFDFLF